jgi:polysaccharide export outer membrane protein
MMSPKTMRDVFLVLGTIASCATVTPNYDYKQEPDPWKAEFVIGVGDGIRINVWKTPELSTDARVRPDGTITMPLLGDLLATNRTPTQLRDEITRRMKTFVRDEAATVTVAVTEVNSYHFTVSGNVVSPGNFTPKFYVRVSEALAMAGGPNKFAGDEAFLLRSDSRGQRRIPLNVTQVISGEHPEQNLVLVAGDTLYVP